WFTNVARLGMLIMENPQRRNNRGPPGSNHGFPTRAAPQNHTHPGTHAPQNHTHLRGTPTDTVSGQRKRTVTEFTTGQTQYRSTPPQTASNPDCPLKLEEP
ncbi:MAG TPA: hypothetical protein PLT68_10305, partial [Actinomycetota bacterium]|nr:hypothetical protein [Actinomycetota bacterium]